MAYFARPIETTFTPPVAGTVRVIVVFDLAFDVGAFANGAPFCEQSAVTSYGQPVGTTSKRVRQSFTVDSSFPVTAGSLVKVGLAADGPGLRRMSFYNLALVAEFTPS